MFEQRNFYALMNKRLKWSEIGGGLNV